MTGAEAAGGVALVAAFALGLTQVPAEPDPRELFRFADPDVVESSGLVVQGRIGSGDALVATVNDSGDGPRVFVVDPGTGETVGTTTYRTAEGDDPDDVEALAPGAPGRVWVADIGDNLERRDELFLYDVPVAAADLEVDPEPVVVRYPDGAHDAESLLRHPRTGRLLVVTKDVLGGTVHALPAGAGPGDEVTTEPLGRVLGLATDAAFFPDGRHLVVRNYTTARVYSWPALAEVGRLPLPGQPQGEGIAVDAAGRVLVSSEGVGEPVLLAPLPADLQVAMARSGDRAPDGGGSDPDAPTAQDGASDARADDVPGRRPWGWAAGLLLAAGIGWLVARTRRR